jgi:hypothetical protein
MVYTFLDGLDNPLDKIDAVTSKYRGRRVTLSPCFLLSNTLLVLSL